MPYLDTGHPISYQRSNFGHFSMKMIAIFVVFVNFCTEFWGFGVNWGILQILVTVKGTSLHDFMFVWGEQSVRWPDMLVRMRNNNVPSSGDPCKFMHDMYIAEIYTPEAIFLSVTMWVDWHSILHSKLWKKWHLVNWHITVLQGHLR